MMSIGLGVQVESAIIRPPTVVAREIIRLIAAQYRYSSRRREDASRGYQLR